MDFARKQLEKYGWTHGKGLGKHEDGISEALKPKLKRSVTGIGHDTASDFTEHWWKTLYNKAAENVQVEEKNGRTKKIKIKDEQFKITNSTFHLNKKQNSQNEEEYADYFVKKSVLTGGGSEMEKVKDSESEEEVEKQDAFKMTDEELFAACEGRTAHKGARHGLRALGKLARIERQEQMLLNQPQYDGYSHSKKKKKPQVHVQVIENMNITTGEEECDTKKKKKKRKRRISGSKNKKPCENDVDRAEVIDSETDIEEKESGNSVASTENGYTKTKKGKRKSAEADFADITENIVMPKKRKKRRDNSEPSVESQTIIWDQLNEESWKVKTKKKLKNDFS